MELNRLMTHSLHDPRIRRILSAALDAVDPYQAVQDHLPKLEGRIFGLGIGKAALPMMDALAERTSLSGGLAITKFASGLSRPSYTVIEGGHPIPDARSLRAGQQALEFVASLKEDDMLVCLISGGGSALMTYPYIPFEEMQALTSLLLASGARIDEINTLRRHLDRVKGGGIARATKANIISLILSDVIGNPLETIASGPTVSDPTSRVDAIAILEKYFPTPTPIVDSVSQWLRGSNESPDDLFSSRTQNIIIGDNKLAAQTALMQAEHEGFHTELLTNELQGEARDVGIMLAQKLRSERSKRHHPFCLIAGGETTVTIKGEGKGGRNQELALSAVDVLSGLNDVMLVALATDGDDGPTDAAGAVVTGETAQRAKMLGVSAADHLSRNDAYPFFQALDDLLLPGPTGTNVNDLIFLIAT